MTQPAVLTINTDGAARNNPGPAAFAYVIARDGQPPIEEAACIGEMTNNQAEYTALVRALEHAVKLGTHHRLIIRSDSELMVMQMRGKYKVRDAGLRPLYEQARQFWDRFDTPPTIEHVRREQNRRADELCNEALDGVRFQKSSAGAGPRKSATKSAPRQRQPAGGDSRTQSVREEAVTCLQTAAQCWARGNADDPPPEMVFDQLWSILEEHDLLR